MLCSSPHLLDWFDGRRSLEIDVHAYFLNLFPIVIFVENAIFSCRQIFWLQQLLPSSEKKTISCLVLHKNSFHGVSNWLKDHAYCFEYIFQIWSSYVCTVFNIFSWFSPFDSVIVFPRVHLFRITSIAINCNEICVKRSLKSHLNISSELSVHLLHKRRARNSDLHFKCKKPLYGSLYVGWRI